MNKPQNILSERIENLTNELQVMTTCRDHWKTSYEERKYENAALREENDLQRDSIQQLSAQVAGYLNVLKVIHAGCTPFLKTSDLAKDIAYACYKALNNPDPGADIRERLVKPEITNSTTSRDIECTESYDLLYRAFDITKNENETLRQALAALEGPADE